MCAFPECRRDLLQHESATLQGEIAHIIAVSSGGPRGRDGLPAAERDLFENLLLLCPNHHSEVDGDTRRWSIGQLRQMKREHEAWVKRQRALGETANSTFGSPYYMNVRRILLDPSARGVRDDLDRLDLTKLGRLDGLEFGTALRIVSAVEDLISRWEARAMSLEAGAVGTDDVGARVKVVGRFYTKNCPTPGTDYELTGNIATDPHIWTRVGKAKATVPLDPRWFTSNSSYVWFTAGNARFAVIGNLMSATTGELVIAPLVVALPNPELRLGAFG
jgi:hypothetical protein